jgi:hypothetical protein
MTWVLGSALGLFAEIVLIIALARPAASDDESAGTSAQVRET